MIEVELHAELSPTRRRWTKWEQEKTFLQDVMKELQFIQNSKDKLLEMMQFNDLKPIKS